MFLFMEGNSLETSIQCPRFSMANFLICWQKAEEKNESNRLYIKYTLDFLPRARIIFIPDTLQTFFDIDDSNCKTLFHMYQIG